MQKVERGEILGIAEYEQIRERFRSRVIAEKKTRRVALGPVISAVFENHDTVLLQIQEMLRTERITREGAILHEIETYNELLPGPLSLSATLFVEIPDAVEREKMLVDLDGLEPCFFVEVDGRRFAGNNETRGVMPGRTTAVHYVKFPVDEAAAAALKGGKARLTLGADHPRYRHAVELSSATVKSLSEDLA